MKDGETKLVFDLEVEIDDIGKQFNKYDITPQDFFGVNDSISQMLEEVFTYEHFISEIDLLGFPKLEYLRSPDFRMDVNKASLKGTVNGIVFYDSDVWLDNLISAFKKLSDQYDCWWTGEFREYTGEDVFRYKAPDFKIEELN